MAGKPGMKGGGGARPGAGRPKKAQDESLVGSAPAPIEPRDMLTLLQDVALGRVEATTVQVRAAIAAVQYTHIKKGDGGKKDEDAERAKKAGAGRFAPSAPPQLVVNNRK